MATTDSNLQVINSMTQTKLNELKNSEGKIPSLANQLIMTDEDDVNIDCLRSEVIYDKDSSDSAINWGKTGGILGTESVSGKDFSMYDTLIIHINFANDIVTTGVIDLTQITSKTNQYKNKILTGGETDSTDIYFCYVKVDSTKTTISNDGMGYFYNGTTVNKRDSNTNYYIFKIEGILKTPAMLYTGEQLFAGNGISIDNGTIGITPAQAVATNTTRTGQNDTVVEYYMSSDGNTWYRKWASGWKECGLHVVKTMTPPANGANSGFGLITLPITFSNKLYQTQITNEWKQAYGNKFFFSAERSGNTSTNNAISVAVTTCTNSSMPSSMQIACNIYCCGF